MDGERGRMKVKRREGKARSQVENRKETKIKQEWCQIQKDRKNEIKGGKEREEKGKNPVGLGDLVI